MNDCITCGRRVRLGHCRVSINRKRGMAMWIEPAEGDNCPCLKEWEWTKWKADKTKPSITEKKITEWNAANPTVSD